MKLSDRVMVCDCGNIMDRDLNAAMNLKNNAASSAVSACGEEGSGLDRKIKAKPASAKQEVRFEQKCSDATEQVIANLVEAHV